MAIPLLSAWSLGSLLSGYLQKSGGTMTGDLVLAGDPDANLKASTKQYVDTGLAAKLDKAGGTMTGDLVLAGDPDANLKAATKQYVDNAVGYPAPRVLAKTSGTSIDFADVEVVTFSYASPATISSFSNLVVHKTYLLRNVGASSITIDRTNAHLHGSANVVLDANDAVLVLGRTATFIQQVAPKADNG